MPVRNFSAGPSRVPAPVLDRAAAEMRDYRGSGLSFMELSHRDAGGPVQALMTEHQDRVRRLLSVPDNYHVLFTHGGAHAQFSAVPLNLLKGGGAAGIVDTGQWARKARREAEQAGFQVRTVASSTTRFPPPSEWRADGVGYVHVCANETMTGVEMLEDPDPPHGAVLVGDFTSTLMSRPVDVSKYGVLYASSGKNLGPAGYCLVIVRDDVLRACDPACPPCLSWREQALSRPIPNLYNTPPTYVLYLSSLVLADLEARGGVQAAQERARERAALIYAEIDRSGGFYTSPVDPDHRSRMNVPFSIHGGRELEARFLRTAEERELLQLAGHPQAGGLRVTLYNAFDRTDAEAVAAFMREFRARWWYLAAAGI